MFKKSSCLGLVALISVACVVFAKYPRRPAAARPLGKGELLALVAGESLPENIVYEIRTQGLRFTPSAGYKSLLEAAGADPRVLASLDGSKVTPAPQPEPADDSPLLQNLSDAGRRLKVGQFDDAAKDLTTALNTGDGKSELGFVMGMILIDKQRYREAGEIYSEIFVRDPGFPQVHTRLSLVYYYTGDSEEALKQAKAAEQRNPDDPAAHLNAGLALRNLNSLDAAKSEIQGSIRCKPDYEIAYAALGFLFANGGDFDNAIEQYKKALTLKPADTETRTNLGVAYAGKGDFVSAIREYREVKRIDPNNETARQNLGSALLHTDPAAAITEFRELAALDPDQPICHNCLGSALYDTGRFEEAKKEYRVAAEIDPTSTIPYAGLGRVAEAEKQYDEALQAFRKAQQIDSTFADAYAGAGRILLLKKDYPAAIAELKRAEELDPSTWENHDVRGQALEASGDRDGAIAEYTEAVSIAPRQPSARLGLALALEKKGDWVAALTNYRLAANDEPAPKLGIPQIYFDAGGKYAGAKQRFQQHLADLRSAGKTSEAADLENRLRAAGAAEGLDAKFHAAMKDAMQAMQERRFNDAETSAKLAVDIAEKIQPKDGRLPEALGQLGNVFAWRMDFNNAAPVYKRQLTLYQKLYGAQSPMIAPALNNLAMLALSRKDFAGAEGFFPTRWS